MGSIGVEPGAWTGGADSIHDMRRYLYIYFKYQAGPSTTSDDRGIYLADNASNTLLEGNYIHSGLIAIESRDSSSVTIRGNSIEGFSSGGIALRDGSVDVHIHDNFFTNSNWAIRFHNLTHGSGHLAYIYRNIFYQEETTATHIFMHVWPESPGGYSEPEIFFYHNALVGGSRALGLPLWDDTDPDDRLRKIIELVL